MNIQKINIENLKPADYNPRKDLQYSDPEYQKIKRSIETYGYIDPIIVNCDYTIIGGHHASQLHPGATPYGSFSAHYPYNQIRTLLLRMQIARSIC